MSIEIPNDLQQIAAGPELFAGDVPFVREDWPEKVFAGNKFLFGTPFKGGRESRRGGRPRHALSTGRARQGS